MYLYDVHTGSTRYKVPCRATHIIYSICATILPRYENGLTTAVAAALHGFPRNGTLCRDALYVLSNMAAGPATAEGGVVEKRKKAIVDADLIKLSNRAMNDHADLHDVQAHALVLLFNLTTVSVS